MQQMEFGRTWNGIGVKLMELGWDLHGIGMELGWIGMVFG